MGYFDDIPDESGGGTATVALASTFATPDDIRRYLEARSAGASERQALAVGDNGESAYGDNTTNPNDPIVALPPDTPGFGHNRFVELTGPDGKTGIARVSEKMPRTAKLKGDGTIDLKPGAASLIGHPGGVYPLRWRFIDQLADNSAPTSEPDYFAGIETRKAPQAVTSITTSGDAARDYFADIATSAAPNETRPVAAPGTIKPGSLADRIITWFGGGEDAIKRAESQLASGQSAAGERPPAASSIASALDAAANRFTDGRAGTDTLQRLVASGTREPLPGEPSFTNAGIPAVPPQEGTGAQIAAGLANIPIGFANFLLSPGGVATLKATGLLPKVAQTFVGLGFTAQQVNDFLHAKTLQERVSSGLGAALIAGGTAAGAKGVLPGRFAKNNAAPAGPTEPTVPDLRAAADSAVRTETASLGEARPGPPSDIADVAENLAPTDTHVAGAAVRPVPTEQIASRPDLMQFKRMDDSATGENAADRITTSYDPLKAGNLLSGSLTILPNMDSPKTNATLSPTGTTAMQPPNNKPSPSKTPRSSAKPMDSAPATPGRSQRKPTSQTAKARSTTRPSSFESAQQHTARMKRWGEQDRSALAVKKLRPLHSLPALISTPVSSTSR